MIVFKHLQAYGLTKLEIITLEWNTDSLSICRCVNYRLRIKEEHVF
jgi:hypothetical protein